MNKTLALIITIIVISVGIYWQMNYYEPIIVTDFESCLEAGNPAMESYPRQCRHGDIAYTEVIESTMSESEVLILAGNNTKCTMVGIPAHQAIFNQSSRTWWIDLERMPELAKDGCNPACVIFDDTKEMEVNWRCTGALPMQSGITGQITIGPTCSVIKPHDNSCSDQLYSGPIQIIAIGNPSSAPFAVVQSDQNGTYKALLPSGEYSVQPIPNTTPFPRCLAQTITVESDTIHTLDFSCDSGIR